MSEHAAVMNGDAPLPETADTLDKMRALLQERYGIETHKVELDTELSALGLDSLSLVEYAFDLENVLHISLTDLPHELVTVRDLVRYVDQVRRRPAASKAA
ncbi:MAG TPA: acyl carrier protein [Casimicrobiaceae bacterium]|nr:acyl carrier protein [Casimicrobiaceae bacterium]